ncbi:FAD/NAD(P)-binding protein [Streptomyces sp. HNM0663]|uniref:FAD/NAD(P)-binding protein n=1 Tax=Streptomyces chengmaiensis TaxID=3040919 RepID=A0ABT6HGM2_9ACTN|nr:FAD/NAD(P)-binding protein [Streptomyces chengmaiensis]MDH2387911.1 FAD/NAD(P)-binding protein [Streptomyces chengmaiensis]
MNAHAARPAAGSTVPLPYRVVGNRPQTHDTSTLALEPAGTPLPPFEPGQFAMLYAFGAGEIPLSASGVAGRGDRLEHTVRAVGAVSAALQSAAPGAHIGVRGPFGTAWGLDRAAGHDILVVAGGIGLAPLRPLVRAVLRDPGRYGRLSVLVGARTPGDLPFRDDLADWDGARTAHVAVAVDRPDTRWRGEVGIVTELLDRAPFAPARTAAFLCGPEVMMRAAARDLRCRGVAEERIEVSLERNMHCGTGHCGHCQLGPLLLCRDGPVVAYETARPLLTVREL